MTRKSLKTTQRLPLKGRTILVTQAPQQAKRFTTLLKQKGARVLTCPTVDLIPHETAETVQYLRQLKMYDWLIFVSQNAVAFFFQWLLKHRISKASVRGCRVAALGKAVREALKSHGLRVHLIQIVENPEPQHSMMNAFKGKICGKKFLILKSLDSQPIIIKLLKGKEGIVDTLPLYKTILPAENSKILLKYISEERIDAVTFTSPSTVHNFMKMLSPDRQLLKHMEFMTIAALGDITAKTVEEKGLQVRVKPSEFTIPAFVNTLSREL